MQKSLKIAVIGGSGKAGKYLIKELVKKGYSIKALVRNPEKFTIKNSLIELVKGNVRNYESVYLLTGGCNAVISTLGQTRGEKPVFSQAAENIIKAMNANGIKRYIVIAGLALNTGKDNKCFKTKLLSGMMKFIFPSIIKDKQKEYLLLNESNLDWTIVRLPFIKLTERTGDINISPDDCPGGKISASDLAEFLIRQIDDKSYIRKSPFISN